VCERETAPTYLHRVILPCGRAGISSGSTVDTYMCVCVRERQIAPTHFHIITYSHCRLGGNSVIEYMVMRICGVLQCVVVCCSVLWCVAIHYHDILSHILITVWVGMYIATQCKTPQHTHIFIRISTLPSGRGGTSSGKCSRHVCVCVCERERERAPIYFNIFSFSYYCLGGEVYRGACAAGRDRSRKAICVCV